MSKNVIAIVFALGLLAIGWTAYGFLGTNHLALGITMLIAAVYALGGWELRQFRGATATLVAVVQSPGVPTDLDTWLTAVHPALRPAVRARIEAVRAALPGPALTPYLVGLLVMLGMLGTFLGMVVTFKGTVFALEASSDLAAIRTALAAPIKGLGMSFGTSVAGVAASAMLGLMSAISRRERLEAVRLLDARITTDLRAFTQAQRQDDTLKTLQAQAAAMPQVVDRLQSLMDTIEQRQAQLHEQLLAQQQRFHQEAGTAYSALAESVGASLTNSLSASARLAGEAIRPVVETAMAGITQSTEATHQRLVAHTQTEWQTLLTRWQATADGLAERWTQVLQQHEQASAGTARNLDGMLQGLVTRFGEQAGALVQTVQATTTRAQADQAAADQARLAAFHAALTNAGDQLAAEWQQVGARTLSQQQAVCEVLERSAGQISERASAHVAQTLEGVTQLLGQSEALVQSRMASEAQWAAQQQALMADLSGVWKAELTALREQEAEQGRAAVARLEGLEAAVAQHLATLGSALEAPMARLMQTASEVPQAAAQVIAQLRQDMAVISERDNAALAERNAMMAQLGELLARINTAADAQRAAIESLVGSAAEVLQQAGARFADALASQAGQVDEVAARVAASAVELASLGEAFHQGVGLFSASNEKLVDGLQRIEGALAQNLSRSDEQLAYYVAQAREVIDLSISSQQGIVEDLRRLHAQAGAAGAAGTGAAG